MMFLGVSGLLLIVADVCIAQEPGVAPTGCSYSPYDCPVDSACRRLNNKVECLCDRGYQPNEAGTGCFKVLDLGETCTQEGSVCRRGPWGNAYCIRGACRCSVSRGYVQSGHGSCISRPIHVGHALLGQFCSASRRCMFERTQECKLGVCTCKKGLKKAGWDIRSARPFLDECVPQDLFIENI